MISRAEAQPRPLPNQIILARGFWQGLPDGMTAARPRKALPSALAALPPPSRSDVASADDTGCQSAHSQPRTIDRVAPEIALAYAEQAEQEAPPKPPVGGRSVRRRGGHEQAPSPCKPAITR